MPPKKATPKVAPKKSAEQAVSKSAKVAIVEAELSLTIATQTTGQKKRKSGGEDDDVGESEDESPKKKGKSAATVKKKDPTHSKEKNATKANTKVRRSAAGSVVISNPTGVKTKAAGKRKVEEDDEELEDNEPKKKAKTAVAKDDTKKSSTKKGAAAKKSSVEKSVKAPVGKKAAPKSQKTQVEINSPPTIPLHIFVFGEGSQGELGLGAKNEGKKTVIDVQRPRLNPFLEKLDVVQIAVGGMHCAALTVDNKIYTWGVNDQGALGRPTTDEGKMRNADQDDSSDSGSDSEDEDSGLNPSEAEPRQIDPTCFPQGTRFAAVFAGDSTTFALTTTGLVWGWGTFRGNDGVLGFNKESTSKDGKKTQGIPTLIPELKQVKKMAIGTNHALALTAKGKTFAWGAGEQSQLGRRVVARTAAGALVPREFGFQRKNIVDIVAGDYFSYAVEANGTIYAWGHNGYGQTGIPVENNQDDIIPVPTKVESIKDQDVVQLAGGNHHSIARTKNGEVLVWGRLDNAEGGLKPEDMPEDSVIRDVATSRILATKKPLVVPNLKVKHVATGTDTCFVISDEGKAFSWGFSTNYQTGQGTDKDVVEATLVDNSAVRGRQLCFAGVGGQFGVLACEREDGA